jgi:uncharacterized protein (TIGR04562 family)
MERKNKLEKNFLKFPYELFNVVFSQKSFVDISRLNVHDENEAKDYIKNYGYDLSNPQAKTKVTAIINEAKKFIQSYLLEDPEGNNPSIVIPPDILYNDDPVNLIISASQKEKTLHQAWACAILRVAHAITHVDNDLSKYFMPGIKRQIFSRFMEHLRVTRKGEYLLGNGKNGSNELKLKMFEMKNEKSRESLIMKLLHKAENVTSDVFDRIGVRIVTFSKLDVIMVLKYLSSNHVISFANIKPSRTRNNLINVDHFLQGIEELKSHELSNWTENDVVEFLERYLVLPPEEKTMHTDKILKENNPYSSTAYSSVQITVRQLITINDPFNLNLIYRFFFPFEIQILDEESYIESRTGRASHEEYKKGQTLSVRKRVLKNVLKYHQSNLWNNYQQNGGDDES